MQQKLIIYLRAQDNINPDWVIVDESGIQQKVRHGNAQDLSALADGKQVIVMVPAEEVVLTSAALPKMNRSHLVKALPFALEEQVIGDVDTLHFVPADNQSDENLSVAIVAKNKMQEWLALLQSWNVQADVLMPTLFGLPLEENTWIVALQDMAIVRMSAYQGFACDINNLNELLNIALHSTGQAPQQIHIKNYSSHTFVTALNAEINVKQDSHAENQLESDLAINTLKFPYINLMHGAYKSKKSRYPEMNKIWKTAMILSIALLSLLFLYPAISYLILNQRVNNISEQIAEVYKRNFPQSSSIVAPKLRMQEKLQAYMGHAGESKSLILMGTLGRAMNEAKGITIKRLDFQQNRMTLELSAASSQAFSRLTDFMTSHGLTVKQDSANLAGTHVNAIITVE